ncbi:cellulose binding domain-containing protein [Actinoplanes sp. N902-109]|uniref:cellulose binding domain-containing protein n=1 Tax=Actinoplanes sp. (strain N902-109) TaxID=649831 RepID=UPI0003293790|nr:cellulose binding domain-containing protein [Actinoplanes sp. N902-109]AGL17146.1 endoglucanase [Actinoplanes sp. N902-109]
MLQFPLAAVTAAALLSPVAADTYACQVKYGFASTWQTGFQANIDITNVGEAVLYGWTLAFALPAGQSLVQGWNADFKVTDAGLEATAKDYNRVVVPQAAAHPQFIGAGTAPFAKPVVFYVNGIRCSVV